MINRENANVIMRFDSRGGFMEVLNTAFPINKVQMNFIKYDENTNKQIFRIDTYMDIGTALYLSELILTGRLERMVLNAMKTGKFNGKDVNDYTSYFLDMGGKSKENAKRPDGMALSRRFKIQKGRNSAFIIRGEEGPGRTNEQGLIVPSSTTEKYLNIPFTMENMLIFASNLKLHIQSYMTSLYVLNDKVLFRDNHINTFWYKNRNNQGQYNNQGQGNNQSQYNNQNQYNNQAQNYQAQDPMQIKPDNRKNDNIPF